MTTPIFWGLFLEQDLPSKLGHVQNQHVTFGFRKEPPKDIPWGTEEEVWVIGYGNDGLNEGYVVVLNGKQLSVYEGAIIPHITVGVDNGGKPKDTWKLHFESIAPFTVKARWDRFDGKPQPVR